MRLPEKILPRSESYRHPDENRNANERPIAFGGVLVALVGPRLAGLRIEPRLHGCDPRAQCSAAAMDADRSAILLAPNANRIGRRGPGTRGCQHGKRDA